MSCYQIIAEPTNRATMIGLPTALLYIENRIYRSGHSSLSILDEKLRNLYIGFSFKHFSPFYEILNEIVGHLSSSGLIHRWNDLNPKSRKKEFEDIGPQVLTMEHIAIGFQTCLIPFLLSIIVFVIELGYNYVVRKLVRSVGK